jgi:hypothetical protein
MVPSKTPTLTCKERRSLEEELSAEYHYYY